jgi:hypothetical protein
MKKLIILFYFALQTSFAFSQLNKGQWLVGGSALGMYQFYSGASNNSSSSNFQLTPDIGYFIADNLAIGIRSSLSISKYDYTYLTSNFNGTYQQTYITTSTINPMNILAGPFIRYYFLPKSSNVNFLMDAAYAYGFYEIIATKIGTKTNNYNLSLGPVFMLNSHTSIMVIASYQYSKFADSQLSRSNINFGVGFQIHLGKNKDDQPKYNTTK